MIFKKKETRPFCALCSHSVIMSAVGQSWFVCSRGVVKHGVDSLHEVSPDHACSSFKKNRKRVTA